MSKTRSPRGYVSWLLLLTSTLLHREIVKVMAARRRSVVLFYMHTRRVIPDSTRIILAPKNKNNMDEAWDLVPDNFSLTFDVPSHPSTNFS
jgi:hypothetical protein